jgi:hypothetical protein
MKRIFSLLLAGAMLLALLPVRASAVSVGNPGTTLQGEYIVIVNTDPDPTHTEQTGTIRFDSTGAGVRSGTVHTGSGLSGGDVTQGSETRARTVSRTVTTYSVGTAKTIGGQSYTCIAAGAHCYVWMEDTLKADYDTAGKTAAAAQEMVGVYEAKPYEILNLLANGNIPCGDNSGKLSIFLEVTSGSSGFYAGEADITGIHINTPAASRYTAGALENRNGLLVHEGQHALFHRLTCGNDRTLSTDLLWLNEGLSVAAMDYSWGGTDPTGWLDRISGDVNVRNGAALVYDTYRSATAQDYSMPYLYVRYLADQMAGSYHPDEFLRTVYQTSAKGKSPEAYLNALLAQAGIEGNGNFADSLSNFYIALIALQPSGIYGFRGDAVATKAALSYPVYLGQSGQSVALHGTAALVVKTLNGSFAVPSDGGSHIRYYAVDRADAPLAPAQGSGTEADPYRITTPQELEAIFLYPDASFRLAADLDLTGRLHLAPETFTGVLDGAGHSITGLGTALVASNNGVIKDLSVTAAFQGDLGNVAGVIANYNNGTIADVRVGGTVTGALSGSNIYYTPRFGVIAGYNELSGSILRSCTTAAVTLSLPANTVYVGAAVGENRGRLEDVYAAGSLQVLQLHTGEYTLNLGGLVGYIRAAAWGTAVVHCYSVCALTVQAEGLSAQNRLIGRLCGGEYTGTTATVTACYGLDGLVMSGSARAFTDAACGKTDAQLRTAATFDGWDFAAVWKLDGAYPVFLTGTELGTLTASLSKTVYYIGESLELYGATVQRGGSGQIQLTRDMLFMAQWDSSAAGTKTVQGTYRGQSFTVTAQVRAPQSVSGLRIYQTGTTSFVTGTVYTQTGVVLAAKLDGASYETYLYSGFTNDCTAPLTQGTTVTYTYAGAAVSQSITVTEKQATAIALLTPMTRTGYTVGDTADLSGATFRITYNDGTSSPIISYAEHAAYDLHLVRVKDDAEAAFADSQALTADDNTMSLYVTAGTALPSAGGVYAYLADLQVGEVMSLAEQNLYMTIGKTGYDNYAWTESISGGSGDYTTTRLSGALPSWLTVEQYPGDASYSDSFAFTGAPTKEDLATLVYRIKDNVTTQSIDVTIRIQAVPISSECEIRWMTISKANNSSMNLPSDIKGVIDGTTVTFTLPQGTSVSSVNLTGEASRNASAEPYLNSFGTNFTTVNPKTYTITAEDGTHVQTYQVYIRFASSAPEVTEVAVSPAQTTVTRGQTAQFSAVVSGYNHPSAEVTWSVSGQQSSGTVMDAQTGLLQVDAAETAQTLTVTATSQADATKTGTASVTLQSQAEPLTDSSLVFYGKTVVFESDFSIKYYILKTLTDNYDEVYLNVTKTKYDNNGTVTGTETTKVSMGDYNSSYKAYSFKYAGIYSIEIGSNVSTTIYGVKDGKTYEGATVGDYSIKQFCYNQLAKSTATAAYKTLLVDFLNYGASAQTYFGYNTSNLVNAELTTEQAACASTLQTINNDRADTTITNPTVTVSGCTLVFDSQIMLKFVFDPTTYLASGSLSDLTVVVKDSTGATLRTFTSGEIATYSTSATLKEVSYTALNSTEMRKAVTFQVYANGVAVSNARTYSIQSYAYSKQSGTDTNLAALTANMVKYGDSMIAWKAQ